MSQQQQSARPPFDRRLLVGLIGTCLAFYVFSVVVSVIVTGSGISALPQYLGAPYGEALQLVGAGGAAPLNRGDYWALVSANYLHNDLSHLALNLVGLLFLIPPVQVSFGIRRAFVIYAFACLCGALASAWWGEIYSLGASTGIFGLLATLIVIGFVAGGSWGRSFLWQGAILAIANFGMGVVNAGQVSNAGHVGGFVGGALASLMMLRTGSPRGDRLIGALFAAALAATALCLAVSLYSGTYRSWQALEEPQDFIRFILTRRAQDDALYQSLTAD